MLSVVLLAAGAGAVVAAGQTAFETATDLLLPDVSRIGSFNRPGTLTILGEDGEVLQKTGPATRDKLAPGQMPLLLQQAFIAAEDRRFYRHDGVDGWGIARAVVTNVRQGSVEEGASTITQQLARTVFLSQDRTLVRKIKEAALAGKIERHLSKGEILEQYLNYVYLGSSAYGVADAAWVYFSKTPEQLTLPEAALIAGMPPAPSVYSPLVNPDLALQRRRAVLNRMRDAGFISGQELQVADNAPLALTPGEPKYFVSRAPWFTSWVAQELPKVLSKEQLEVGGITVRTGLNAAWQDEAQKVINTYATGSMQGALVAMEPGTGLVRAMVGGKDFNKSQFNRATQALRSPGSTFKLFTYTAALQSGLKPEDTISNKDQCIKDGWPPKLFCIKGTGGTTTLTNAIAKSMNAAAVATAAKVGYPRVVETAKSLGMVGKIGEYPSMVLGANEQYVVDMAAAFAAITNRGLFVPPMPFEEIYGPEGELIWSRRVDGDKGRRAVPSEVADAMQWMLQQSVSGGTGAGAALPDRPVAGKTGTSEGARDLWFVGSIPQLTTAIWLGYDSNTKTGSSSVAATYAWSAFMKPVTKGMPVEKFPPKPVLTGPFIPPKPKENKPKPSEGSSRDEWNTDRDDDSSWDPPPLREDSRLPDLLDLPSSEPPGSWDTPEPSPAPRPAPAPVAAPAPAPAPVTAAPPPPPPAPPPPPPPPLSPPPPLP